VERVPEPELMLAPEQARAYADADFEAAHSHCVATLFERLRPLPERGRAVDLGCGAADITLRVARGLPAWMFDGLDGARAMLDCGWQAVREASLEGRVALHERLLPVADWPAAPYDLVFSNSLLHHLPEPGILWSAAAAAGRPGAPLFVMDLHRPESAGQVRALVEQYAADEPELLRRDFEASLFAAYRADEVREQLAAAHLEGLEVEVVSDRHWIAWGTLPEPR